MENSKLFGNAPKWSVILNLSCGSSIHHLRNFYVHLLLSVLLALGYI
jgi:hypothetical protein